MQERTGKNRFFQRALALCVAVIVGVGMMAGFTSPLSALQFTMPPSAKMAQSLAEQTILAGADARVAAQSPDTNYGTSELLRVDNEAGRVSESYLRFTVTGVPNEVQSAKLRIHATSRTNDGPAIYATGNDWQETTLTWNNRPPRAGSALADTGLIRGDTWFEVDVSPVVRTNGTYSFVLATNNADGLSMASREGELAPRLVLPLVATGPTPTPPPTQQPGTVKQVVATAETDPVPNGKDAADDPAIWINPADPAQSTIIGTDKKGGLAVYDLAGNQLQYLPDGYLNNVDLRPNFPLNGQSVALVVASNRSTNSLGIYKVDPATRRLEPVAARLIATPKPYGLCMYRSAVSGKFYAFLTNSTEQLEQWELFDAGGGKVDARLVRSFALGSQSEGCVADDALGSLYVGEETVGIWKYGAEPGAGSARTSVDTIQNGRLEADIEGLTIAYGPNGTGYLIASSQGNDTFVVYQRQGANAYVQTFAIVPGAGVDGVDHTDGIDVSTANLGPAFPQGVFVAQDDGNDGSTQNFKLVPWQLIGN